MAQKTKSQARGQVREHGPKAQSIRSALAQVPMKLPRASQTILAEEAKLFEWTRGDFLTNLLRDRLGLGLKLQRPTPAPTYSFSAEDWSTTVRWVWYLSPQMRERFDASRLMAGNLRQAAFVTLMLNEWVGLRGTVSLPREPDAE